MNASLRPSTTVVKGTKAEVLKTVLVVDDGSDDVELLRIMFKRSRILNPLQAVRTVRDAIFYLEGGGIYADRTAFPFPTLLLLDLRLRDGSFARCATGIAQPPRKNLQPLAPTCTWLRDLHQLA